MSTSGETLAVPRSLTVLVPAYNEERTVHELLRRVADAPTCGLERDVVVCDDGSKDRTLDEVERFRRERPDVKLTLIAHPTNEGKGSAVRSALAAARGDLVLIQDADLEYDPEDYPVLLAPLVEGRADAVYGSRFRGAPRRGFDAFRNGVNRLLTFLSNLVTSHHLTDMEVGYKALRRDVANALHLRARRFEIEIEITAKLARDHRRLVEVPVRYAGRSYAEGKKIKAWDGIVALAYIFWFRFARS